MSPAQEVLALLRERPMNVRDIADELGLEEPKARAVVSFLQRTGRIASKPSDYHITEHGLKGELKACRPGAGRPKRSM